MGRCGCASECLCTVVGGDCITVAGNGSIATPYTVGVEVDPSAENALSCGESGLFVQSYDSFNFGETDCIEITGTGTVIDPVVATPIIDFDPTNALQCRPDGLYVASSATGGVPVWSTATRPYPSTLGYTYYDTDVPGIMTWSGAASEYTAPWNLPWGMLDYAETVLPASGIGTSYTDLLFVTVDLIYGRTYKVTAFVDLFSTSAGQTQAAITDVALNPLAHSHFSNSANQVQTHNVSYIVEHGGATTLGYEYHLGLKVTAGTGSTQSNVYGPHYIMVEDIGPYLYPL